MSYQTVVLLLTYVCIINVNNATNTSDTSRFPYNWRRHSDEEYLLERLFDNYNPSARPVINSMHTVDVHIQFALMQIQDLNLRNQVLTTTGLLILEWTDERLRWNTEDIPLNDVIVESKKLWRPEFASLNGADSIYGKYGQFRVNIINDGKVHWEPGGVFKTVCEVDITYYPFDEQMCSLVFGAWSYRTSKMNLTNSESTINMDSYNENGEWEVYQTQVQRIESSSNPQRPDDMYAEIQFSIFLRRRYIFYILNVILPSLMTSVLLLSIFFCKPAQKVQIGVVVLPSFHIFLINVSDSIPKTSDHIPILGMYLTCTMAITTLSLVLTVFVLNIYVVTDRPVPDWTRRYILYHLARVLCMRRLVSKLQVNSMQHEARRRENVLVMCQLGLSIATETSIVSDVSNHMVTPGQEDGEPVGSRSGHEGSMTDREIRFESSVRSVDQTIDVKVLEQVWAKEWQKLAEVVDRTFFCVFPLAVIISTMLLFHPLSKAY